MMAITAHSPKYNADGTIDLVVKFPWLDVEVPFCANPSDSEQIGRDIFASASAGAFGLITPYVAPPVVVSVPKSLTPWQMRKALNQLGLRASVESAIAASNDQELKDGWEFATEFLRSSPLVIDMGAALGKTGSELDALFTLGASL